jgi:DNA polymerase
VDGREPDWAAELAAAQAWWREAGVDLAFADAPRAWLAAADPSPAPEGPTPPNLGKAPASPSAPERIGGDRTRWPARLEDFADWWLTEPSLEFGSGRRVPPAGPHRPSLMILVPMPEADDRERLLSGSQGRLLDAMLAAFGTSRDAAYIASVLPRSLPAPDWAGLGAAGLGEVVAHHVALVAPDRLFVLGRDISPLLGHDPAQSAPLSLRFNHEGTSVPLAFAPSLEALLERPGLKRGVWTRWLEWTGT